MKTLSWNDNWFIDVDDIDENNVTISGNSDTPNNVWVKFEAGVTPREYIITYNDGERCVCKRYTVAGTPCSCDSLTVNGILESCSCDSMTPSGELEPEPQPTDYFTVSVSVTNNTNKHIFLDRIELSYQLDDVKLASQFELEPRDTIVAGGEEIPQSYEGNTIYTVGVTYVVEGREYSKLLIDDEWWCTTDKQLGDGDTLYIELNNI
jgi:hypothetical protein